MPSVLALDLASVSGWAVGEPGGKPAHGSHRFARAGASHEAIFAGAVRWLNGIMNEHDPRIVVWEAPMPTSFGTTNLNTTTLLYGLPAVIGAITYLRGVYDIRKADTRAVRMHFIGCNPKRAMAKPMVIRQCNKMGWPVSTNRNHPFAAQMAAGACLSRYSSFIAWAALVGPSQCHSRRTGGGSDQFPHLRRRRAYRARSQRRLVDGEKLGDDRIGIRTKDFAATLVDFGGIRVCTVCWNTYWRRGR